MSDITFENWDGHKGSEVREFIRDKIVALQDESVKTVIKDKKTDGTTYIYFLMTADADEIAEWESGYTEGETTYEPMDVTSPYVRSYYTFRSAEDVKQWNLESKVTQSLASTMVMGASNVVKFNYIVYYGSDKTDIETSYGKATFTINGTVVSDLTTRLISNTDGTSKEYSFDLGEYLTSANNTVVLKVQNADGTLSRSWSFEVAAYSLQVAFAESYIADQYTPKTNNWDLGVKVTGSNGVLHCKVTPNGGTGTELATLPVTAGSTTTFKIDADGTLEEGVAHKIEVWCENTTLGFSSDTITTYFIKKGTKDCISIGANPPASAVQYGSVEVPFFAYLPEQDVKVIEVNIALISNGTTISTSKQNVTLLSGFLTGLQSAKASLMSLDLGDTATMVITFGDIQCQHTFAIEKSDIELTEATNCKVKFNFQGKTNNDSDIDDMTYTYDEEVTAHLTRTGNWKLTDDNGCDGSGFRIPINKSMLLNLTNKFFGKDFGANGTKTGATFAIEIKTSNVVNTDAVVVDGMNDDCGFRVYANRIEVKYAGATDTIVAPFPENERVRVGFVIDGTTTHCEADTGAGTVVEHDYNLGYIYIDGIVARLFEYGTSSWKQETVKDINIGSDECDVEIYSVRVFEKALTVTEWLNTYAYDTPEVTDKLAIATRNAIIDATGEPSMTLIQKRLPNTAIHVWEMESIPPTKKTTVDVASSSFTNPAWDGESIAQATYEAGAHTVKADGTSSEGYPLPFKNLAETLPATITIKYESGDVSSEVYSITYGTAGEKEFVDKINFASSEGILNICAMNMYQKILLTCASQNTTLFTKQQLAQFEANGIEGVTFRQSLSGLPEIGFRKYTEDGKMVTKYWSLFNLINNKYSGTIFGLKTKTGEDLTDGVKAELWEVDENVNFFNQEFTLNTADSEGKLVPSTGVNDLSGYTTLYYSRVPKKSAVNTDNGYGVATSTKEMAQANEEIANLRKLHNWLFSLNPWIAEQYKAQHGDYETLAEPWTSSAGIIYTYDNPSYRRARFSEEYTSYLNEPSACFYFVFCTWIIGMDSMDKNMTIAFDDVTNPIARFFLRDTDSWGRFNNTGVLSYPYYIEWGDTYKASTGEVGQITGCDKDGKAISSVTGATQVFNGAMSGLWALVHDCLEEKIQSMYQSMRSAGLNGTDMLAMWKSFKDLWCEALYNYDAVKRYASTGNLTMAYGDKWALIKDFLTKRTRYMDSKYNNTQPANHTTMRFNSVPTGVWMEHSMPIYASFVFGSTTTVNARSIDGETAYLATPSTIKTFQDATCYINDADLVTAFGGYTLDENGNKVKAGIEALGQVAFTQADLANLSKLEEFVMAYTADNPNTMQGTWSGTNPFVAFSELKNFKRLKRLIMTYVEGYNGIMEVGSPNLEEIDLTGTECAGLIINEAKSDLAVAVPSTLKSLVINAEGIDTYTLCKSLCDAGATLNTLTISESIDWTSAEAEVVSWLADAATCNVKGKINISDALDGVTKVKLIEKFGDIDDESNDLYITYTKVSGDVKMTVSGQPYIKLTGDYEYKLTFLPTSFNDIKAIGWSVSENASGYATVDGNGTLHVTALPSEESEMVQSHEKIQVIATITMTDGTTQSKSYDVALWPKNELITITVSYASAVAERASTIHIEWEDGTTDDPELVDDAYSFSEIWGLKLKITFPSLSDAKDIDPIEFTTGQDEREISVKYKELNPDMLWVMEDGTTKDVDETFTTAEKAKCVGLYCNFTYETSVLGITTKLADLDSAFIIPREYLTGDTAIQSIQWHPANGQHDFSCLSYKSSPYENVNGDLLTTNILSECAEYSVKCLLATYCRTITFDIDGNTKSCFFAAYAQMYLIAQNSDNIKTVTQNAFGIQSVAFNEGYWHTASEDKNTPSYNDWLVYNGAGTTFNMCKEKAYPVIPLIPY